ncbi:MAG: hypothetical protein K6A31_07825 [Fibrobacter sp.]|nr:hypothetical protein [Fibrobacter sp.]
MAVPTKMFKIFFGALLVTCAFAYATEVVRPVTLPQTSITFGGIAELRDDVYSADARFSTEVAFCKCFSLFSDVSYRFISLQYEVADFEQQHEILDLKVNGFNESYLGFKLFPVDFFGVSASFRFAPGEGSQNDRFQRIAVEPLAVYPFSKYLLLGASLGYYTFIEQDNFQPGDEIGGQASFVWKPFYSLESNRGLQLSYVFLLRHRINESQNKNLLHRYQKMDDAYWGFRMRGEIAYFFKALPFGYGFGYEMNRGTLFGFETGHRVELFLRYAF